MNAPSTPKPLWKSRLQLIAIVAVFVGPFIAANWYHSKLSESGVDAVKANGDILQPAVSLVEFSARNALGGEYTLSDLKDKWTLIQVVDVDCGSACERNRTLYRDIWLALGKEAKRVKRWFIADQIDVSLAEQFPELRLLDKSSAVSLLEQMRSATSNMPDCYNCSYLVDPNGNVMMRFDLELEPTKIFRDLRVLLKVSRIG